MKTTPKRALQDRSVETHARLLDAAIACLSELGYAGATTPLIAQRAGVTRGALQHHFPSRSDLDLAVIDHLATTLNFSLDADAMQKTSLATRVSVLVGIYWAAFDSPLFRAALHIWLSVLRDDAAARRLEDHLVSLSDAVESSWRLLFRDTALSTAELASLRHVVMSAARGHAVERLFLPRASGRRERVHLERMMLRELQARDPAPQDKPQRRTTARA